MTATPPKPTRRRWRWLVVGLLLLASSGAWLVLRDSELIRRARRLRIGQTRKEVAQMMGPWTMMHITDDRPDEYYGHQTQAELLARQWMFQDLGWTWQLPSAETFAIELNYDSDDRVRRIRIRGEDFTGQ